MAASSGFECPVCRTGAYEQLTAARADGSRSLMDFYRCVACGFAFCEAHRYLREVTSVDWRDCANVREHADRAASPSENDLQDGPPTVTGDPP